MFYFNNSTNKVVPEINCLFLFRKSYENSLVYDHSFIGTPSPYIIVKASNPRETFNPGAIKICHLIPTKTDHMCTIQQNNNLLSNPLTRLFYLNITKISIRAPTHAENDQGKNGWDIISHRLNNKLRVGRWIVNFESLN